MAQTSPGLLPPVKVPAYQQTEQTASTAQVGGDMHLAESKVELAWLADPLTFPYALEARTMGTALEIRGEVLTESDRQQALRIAQEESGMRVIDKLRINARLSLPHVSKPTNQIHREAVAILGEDLPLRVKDLSVSIWTNGQILVKGAVSTYEDKLAISQRLRRVKGCSCIINQIRVAGSTGVAAATSVPARQVGSAASISASPPAVGAVGNQTITLASHQETSSPPIALTPQPQAGAHAATSDQDPSAAADAAKKNAPGTYYPTKWRRMKPADAPAAPESIPPQAKAYQPPAPARIDNPSQAVSRITPVSTSIAQAATTSSTRPDPTWTAPLPTAPIAVTRTTGSQGTSNLSSSIASGDSSSSISTGIPQNSNSSSQPLTTRNTPAQQGLSADWRAATTTRSPYASVPVTYQPTALVMNQQPAASTNLQTSTATFGQVAPQTNSNNGPATASETTKPVGRAASLPAQNWSQAPATNMGTSAGGTTGDSGASRVYQNAPKLAQSPKSAPPANSYVTNGVVMVDASVRQAALASAAMPGNPHISAGIVMIDSSVRQAALASAEMTSKEHDSSRSDSYVTTGTVVFDAPEPKAKEEPRLKPGQLLLQTCLQQRIAAVCGKPGQDVKATLVGEKELQVCLKAKDAQEGQRLSSKIFQMSELGPYEVSLDVVLP
ncbi:MAG TPA: hypothetical protein VK395_36335 [Gemmataceae bacterium]|nr:hypothetical protein [Gemmataceae bacterium]